MDERGPTVDALTLEAITLQAITAGIIFVSATTLHTMAQRLSHAEELLTQLFQWITPWVLQAISDSEGRMHAFAVAAIHDRIFAINTCINAFEERVQKR